MKINISVDRATVMQGVWDARDDKKISPAFAERIWKIIKNTSQLGPDGRYVCKYTCLIVALSQVNAHWSEVSRLWEYLGKSLSDGIGVSSGSWAASVERERE